MADRGPLVGGMERIRSKTEYLPRTISKDPTCMEAAATNGTWPIKVGTAELNLAAEFLALVLVMLKGSAGSFELRHILFGIHSILDAGSMMVLKGLEKAGLLAKEREWTGPGASDADELGCVDDLPFE